MRDHESCMSAATVVYVHGLWLTGGEGLVLRRRLERDFGMETHPYRYSSTTATMRDCAEGLERFISALAPRRLHLVGHSLGGLVIYRLLERCKDRDLPPGRAMFLGTPAVGSRAATVVGRIGWLAPLVGRCVAEELMRPRERCWTFARELGVIAGTQPLGLGQFFARFAEESDGTIAVRETRLPGLTAHLTLPVSHMGMLLSPRVAREVGGFLEQGRFDAQPCGGSFSRRR